MSKTVMKYGEEEFDFLLIGIVSTFRDFRICREVNKSLSLSLVRGDDYSILDTKRNEELTFPFFDYVTEYEDQYCIIGNRSENGILIPERKQIDYFLVIKPGATPIEINNISAELKKSHLIQAVFNIDPNELRSRGNLLF